VIGVKEIVEVVEDCLYAVIWSDSTLDSFDRMVDELQEHSFLSNYLEKNKEHIQSGYYKQTDIEKCVEQVQDEFYDLNDEIIERAEKGKFETLLTLEKLFEPLDGREPFPNYRKAKLKNHSTYQPMLRIYGCKEDENKMVITGYGIKFTEWMDDHGDTKLEREKIDLAIAYIDEHGL